MGKGKGKGRGKRRKRRRKEGRAVGSRAVGRRRKTIRYGGHWSSSQRVWTMSTIVSMIVIVIVMAIMLLLLRTRTMEQQQGQPHCRTVVGGGDDSES